MKTLAIAMACGMVVTNISAASAAPRTMVALVQQIDASFVCPETLPEDLRKASLDAMARRMAAHGLSYAQGMSVLRVMLTTHRCGMPASSRSAVEHAEIEPAGAAVNTSPVPEKPVKVAVVGAPQ